MKSNPATAANRLRRLCSLRPTLALVLGTGFDHVLKDVRAEARVAYQALPGFGTVTTSGHRGELVVGRLAKVPVIVLAGRTHYYEGHGMESVTFAVRVLAAYGVRDLLLTNAAGGINPRLRAGDFMVVKDHINFMGTNPLRGPPAPGLARFVDLSCTYDAQWRGLLKRAGRDCGLRMSSGVYLAVSGPSYETPAEIKAFRTLGADAVGMSTVPEAMVARQCGLRVVAVSCITNLAAGRGKGPLSHREVLETAQRVRAGATQMLRLFVRHYAKTCPLSQ